MTTGTGAFAIPGEGEQVPGNILTLRNKKKKVIKEVIDILEKIIKKENGRNC